MTQPLITWELVKAYQTLIVGIPTLILIYLAYRQLIEMKNARIDEVETRHTELLMRCIELWESGPFIEARNLIYDNKDDLPVKKWKDEESSKYFTIIRIPNFFETLGYLETRGCVDFDLISQFFGYAIESYFNTFENYIENEKKRKDRDLSELFIYFEKLYDKEMNSRAKAT